MEPIRDTRFTNLNNTGQAFSPGRTGVTKMVFENTQGATAFIQIFDSSTASVTLGTTVPMLEFPLAASTGMVDMDFSPPLLFETQMVVYSTTAPGGSTGSSAGVHGQAFVN
jgi:hypothetical protein